MRGCSKACSPTNTISVTATQSGRTLAIWCGIVINVWWPAFTLKARLKSRASGLTPRAAFEKFAAVQMLDVHLPTTDGCEIVLTRYTQPEKDLQLLLQQLKITLPEQAPPKIQHGGSADLLMSISQNSGSAAIRSLQSAKWG